MAGVDLFTVKEILGHRDIATTMRYSHLSPGFLQEAVNRESLIGTGSKTGSSPSEHNQGELSKNTKLIDLEGEESWLGEKDSNPHSQNQNLTSYGFWRFLHFPYHSQNTYKYWSLSLHTFS